jgi:AraC-like DNA-binding protein
VTLPDFQYLTLYHVSQETRWHHHPHPELGYVMTGSFVLKMRGKGGPAALELHRDSVFLVPAGLRHQERPLKGSGAEVIYLGAFWPAPKTGADILSLNLGPTNPLKSLLLNLLEAHERLKGDGKSAAPRLHKLSCALILETLQMLKQPHTAGAQVLEPKSLLNRAQNLIGSHFHNKRFGPSVLARGLGISLRGLQIQFRKYRGYTPVEAILQARMNRARELLAFTREPIPVIAALCGFSSPGYFMRSFRKYVGMTASRYRKEHALRESAPPRNFYPPTAENVKKALE